MIEVVDYIVLREDKVSLPMPFSCHYNCVLALFPLSFSYFTGGKRISIVSGVEDEECKFRADNARTFLLREMFLFDRFRNGKILRTKQAMSTTLFPESLDAMKFAR